MKPDTAIAPILLKLQECMCHYLSDPATMPLGGPVCLCCLVWSDTIFMDGCDCECTDGSKGRAYVRFVRFEGRNRDRDSCPSGLDVTIELGIMRCYDPTVEVPDCQTTTTEALVGLADLYALRRIISCCAAIPKRYSLDEGQPVGPQGGCIGATVQVTFSTPW